MRVAVFFTLLALATSSVSAQWRLLSGSSSTNGWLINNNATATGDKNPVITAVAGTNVTFSHEAGTAHPFGFNTVDVSSNAVVAVPAWGDAGCTNGTNTWFQTAAAPCIITVTVPAAGTTWFYKCIAHPDAMKGQFVSVAPAAAGGSSSSSSSTGAAATGSSSSSSTGAAPVVSSSSSSAVTTPAPKGNGTAAVAMPALTVVLATITAAAIVA